ncbi:MAG: hypothetical protein OEZ68_18925 [Gammaproteobacteria bacterium]|nr:hypothetical protein [Gammaproteobacteria bacterium]MDH5802881.1 hypothetical protein [Gammaproteobacteria bacterium]
MIRLLFAAAVVLLVDSAFAASLPLSPLPTGDGDAAWGMNVEQLQQTLKVHKATPGSEYSYADHAETNPDVYVRKVSDGTRYEYYFFKGVLYKIYIVYSKNRTSPTFYRSLVQETAALYGKPKGHYQETVFGIPVTHTVWEDQRTNLDIRSGAGFVYRVLQDRIVLKEKTLQKQRENSI